MINTEKVDVLVIGAGPAGCVAASIVHQAGLKVKVVEKELFPRFVIGESLLPRTMEALDEAKLLDAIKAEGFQEKFGAKFVRGKEVCDFNFSDQFTKGWGWTWQVPREDFDTILAREVKKMGVDVAFETMVTDIQFSGTNSVTTIKDKSGKESKVEARFIIDSSGYGRVIPRLFNLDRPSNLPMRKTLFAHIEDPNRSEYDEPNRIIVIVHEPQTWIWVIPFSNGYTSVGFVGFPSFFDQVSGLSPEESLRKLIKSDENIAKRFGDAKFRFPPRTLEGWSVSTDKFYGDGFALTGNVTEFLDPVFSSGVTLAVSSSQLAANLVVKQLKNEKVDWKTDYQEEMMKGVDTFRTYVNGWYDGSLQEVFFTKQSNPEFKNQICSILAGYVWDQENPFVRKHERALKSLVEVLRLENAG
jgi:flavin-dependent dehydrogenase